MLYNREINIFSSAKYSQPYRHAKVSLSEQCSLERGLRRCPGVLTGGYPATGSSSRARVGAGAEKGGTQVHLLWVYAKLNHCDPGGSLPGGATPAPLPLWHHIRRSVDIHRWGADHKLVLLSLNQARDRDRGCGLLFTQFCSH